MSDKYISELRSSISQLHKLMRKSAHEVESFNLTELETFVLIFRNPGILSSRLAEALHITNQSMSQILGKFDEIGAIKRTVSEQDKRKMQITLTEKGHQMVEQTRIERDKWLQDRIEKLLTTEEIELLRNAVPVLQKLLVHG